MIVRQFIEWMRTAPREERAEASSALARAYLYSDLSPDDRAAAEGAMLILLDDTWPLVRRALADVLAASPSAPGAVVYALANDRPEIAAPVLALSPLLIDVDLIDAAAMGTWMVQSAIASRAALPRPVAAAIAEVGSAEACLVLLNNRDAEIEPFSLDRILERYGHLDAIREPLAARKDLSANSRLSLIARIGQSLAGHAVGREWLDVDNALRVAREACEKMKMTAALAAQTQDVELRPIILHLRGSGQLTAGLILRALLSGKTTLFEGALGELADIPAGRVSGLIRGGSLSAVRALFDRAGLPASTFPAFKEAIETMRQGRFVSEPGGAARVKRRMIERVLARCQNGEFGGLAPFITLLHRFATEAARDDARLFFDGLAPKDVRSRRQRVAA
jgi:uncharacterized protein (DUF2336 family)